MTLASTLAVIPGDGSPHNAWFADRDGEGLARIAATQPALAPIFAASPFLFALADEHAQWLDAALDREADEVFDALIEQTARTVDTDFAAAGEELRRVRGQVALLCGLAEIGGVWTTAQSTRAMSTFADATLHAVLGAALGDAGRKGKIDLPADQHPAEAGGIAIFALGKHGGQELNYSSDIDLVAFYDPEAPRLADPSEAGRFYTRILQKVIAVLEERDATGAVFRTDLRLRPDPSSTPLAISVSAALQYYESRGQSWERAAWIKARVVAGDSGLGEEFLDELAPFVWRKHLDYATIADVQALKRQINLSRRIGDERVGGHNVKLGRGGIREIEFFTQTQQLIAGGRNRALRVRSTTEALGQLLSNEWISPETHTDMMSSYWYLRAVENRLQMRRDEQTHVMPESDEELEVVARMMGEVSLDAFKGNYLAATGRVMSHYAELFSSAETLSTDTGNLVFTGNEDDPDTLETLANLGFEDPERAAATFRRWHAGGYPATRAAAARQRLTALMPDLIRTIAEAGNADEALARFDSFLIRLPAGVQLFSLLSGHEHLRRLLVDFMASAPRLAEEVIHRAHIMDGLIDPAFSSDINRPSALVSKVDGFLLDAKSYEDLIDRTRLIGQEQKFLISAGLISSAIDAPRAGQQFTALAQTLLDRLFVAVRTEFEQRHGKIPGARAGILAFGKLASGEMTATSDIDFIMIYSLPDGVDHSDGARPLDAPVYYARLTQRLVAALSAPTAAGVLYEADMRLRPSGNAGPLATRLSAFRTYQTRDAWTWEHLALTRARAIVAEPKLREEVGEIIEEVLSAPRDPGKAIADVIDMRARLRRDRKPRHAFDLKLAEGGLIDLEFIAQSAMLLQCKRLDLPHAPAPDVFLRMAEHGLLPEAERLIHIHNTYSTVLQAMSACLVRPFQDDLWTKAFRDLLARLTNSPDFAFLEADLAIMQKDVSAAADAWYERARKL